MKKSEIPEAEPVEDFVDRFIDEYENVSPPLGLRHRLLEAVRARDAIVFRDGLEAGRAAAHADRDYDDGLTDD